MICHQRSDIIAVISIGTMIGLWEHGDLIFNYNLEFNQMQMGGKCSEMLFGAIQYHDWLKADSIADTMVSMF